MQTAHPNPDLHFRPLIDWWVLVILSALILMFVSIIPVALWMTTLSVPMTILLVIIAIGLALYFIDMTFYSMYVLQKDALHIVSNLRHAVFPYREMRALKPGGIAALFSRGVHKRFALSRKNVIIKLAEGRWSTISVSPQDKDRFLHTILERIDSERSSRASRAKGASASSK